jgi:protein gp37
MALETRIVSLAGTIRYPIKNIWLGVSCEDQKTADERIPILLQTPAAVRFVSLEPLLGPIDLGEFQPFLGITKHAGTYKAARGVLSGWINWVIVGGESGPNARPMHPDWVSSIRDQCQEAGVPFFFKQWGEYSFAGNHVDNNGVRILNSTIMQRVGKKVAGRILDGREWNEYPEEKDDIEFGDEDDSDEDYGDDDDLF